ncbi:hypothetical protein Nhal_3755 [Nitrosococcus halophilus Nc 4]|uniref:Lipoprotein n=1 Tax=Nitrosococcus halophilus (strain Nc4) TaxID=472759 RepID=D5C2U6_NITHN|nr:hypothetical protein Nhal_3755 [Nitrosococcus halophilus Nc 4]
MRSVKLGLLLLCAVAFTVGLVGCEMEKSDMAPDQSSFLEQFNR